MVDSLAKDMDWDREIIKEDGSKNQIKTGKY